MIRTVKRGQEQAAGAVRYSVGRKSSGTGAGCRPLHALANPFRVAPHGPHTREENLARYGRWLHEKVAAEDPAVCGALNELWRAAKAGEVELECFCSPLACHADVIKRVVDETRPHACASGSRGGAMTKVFVSGSRGVTELPAEAEAALDKIRELGFTVLVGDCHGADALVQAHLKNYRRVVVFHIGERPRTNLGFDTARVAGSRQTDKDAAMADQADYGLAIWDGQSPGTAKNIERVKATKVVRV